MTTISNLPERQTKQEEQQGIAPQMQVSLSSQQPTIP